MFILGKDERKETKPKNPNPISEETINSISEDSFESLFQNLSSMKSKAANLPPSQRKDFAKEMTMAFWRAMGQNDSEFEGLSSDSE